MKLARATTLVRFYSKRYPCLVHVKTEDPLRVKTGAGLVLESWSHGQAASH